MYPSDLPQANLLLSISSLKNENIFKYVSIIHELKYHREYQSVDFKD
jgi:hypothetical protein